MKEEYNRPEPTYNSGDTHQEESIVDQQSKSLPENEPSKPKSSSKLKWVAASIVVVIIIIGAVAASIVLIGNKSSEGKESQQLSPETPKEKVQVTISATKFSPATIKIARGDYVTWVNNDEVAHQLRFLFSENEDSASTETGSAEKVERGASFSHIFDKAGTYKYYDEANPIVLKGTIIVEQE